ncbi:MAG: FAD-dependent monooxygenase [Pseudomonadota bacterium]
MAGREKRLIAVSGAGIAGLTAALCLERAGFHVIVFEKHSTLPKSGAGIQISPNGYKVLRNLGLDPTLKTVGFAVESIDIHAGRSGALLSRFDAGAGFVASYGAPLLMFHRADLGQILENACKERADIEIRYGESVEDVATHARGVTVLTNRGGIGLETQAQALIGADGVWSALRKQVPTSGAAGFSGWIAWRSLIDADSLPDFISKTSTGLWLGRNAHVVHYPLRQGKLVNVVAVTQWDKEAPPPKGWTTDTRQTNLDSVFSRWGETVQVMLKSNGNWGGWPIFAMENSRGFASGPLCLIGDAAHAMTPHAAQGGVCAIEDASVLAACCMESRSNLPTAFQQFEKWRLPRVKMIMRLAQKNRSLYHMGGPLALARNLVMPLLPQSALQARMAEVYGWEPPLK